MLVSIKNRLSAHSKKGKKSAQVASAAASLHHPTPSDLSETSSESESLEGLLISDGSFHGSDSDGGSVLTAISASRAFATSHAAASLRRKISKSFKASLEHKHKTTSKHPKQPRPRRTILHRMCTPGVVSYASEVIATYLASHPDEALMVDRKGHTPLHTVLARLPHRHDIVELLVAAAPQACQMRDLMGRTPLHHAAQNARSVKAATLELLLKHDPSLALDEDGQGETPFGIYCSALEGAGRTKASKIEGGGSSIEGALKDILWPILDKSVPLVRAIAWGDPAVPESENDENNNNNNNNGGQDNHNDNHAQIIHGGNHHNNIFDQGINGINNIHNNDNQDQQQQDNQQDQQQQQNAADNEAQNKKLWEGMLHASLYAVKRATSDCNRKDSETERYKFLLRLVLRRTHDDKKQTHHQAAELDSRGNLPLHIAASIPDLNEMPAPILLSSSSKTKVALFSTGETPGIPAPLSDDVSEGIVDALVRLHPEAASVPNAAGLLPFDIAERNKCGWTKGGVGALVGANCKVLLPGRTTGNEGDGNGRPAPEIPDAAMPEVLSQVGTLNLGAMFEVLRERPEALLQASAAER